LSFRVLGDIGESENAFAFVGLELSLRQKPAKPTIGHAIGWVDEQARCIFEIETGTDHKPEFVFLISLVFYFFFLRLRRHMRAHNARERIAIRYGDCRKS